MAVGENDIFVWCLLLCSASAIVSVHRSVRGRTRSWRPVRGHTKGQPVTFTVLNGCKSVWLFISVSFLFWRDTCGVPDSSHVIHRHVGIQSWKCSIHRFWIQIHANMWKSMVFSLRPTFLFSSLQLEDGVYRVKSVFSLLRLILHEKHAQ